MNPPRECRFFAAAGGPDGELDQIVVDLHLAEIQRP